MNIHKRTYPSGRNVWRARYPDPSYGGRKQIERQFGTRREAEQWLTGQKAALNRGDHIDPRDSGRLLDEAVRDWEATWLDLEPKTRLGYSSILKRHVLPRWSGVRINSITPHAVQAWINELAETRKPGTVRHIYFVLRGVMKLAVERHYVVANPCDSVRIPRIAAVAEGSRVILDAREVALLADSIAPRYRLLVYTAAYGGLRAGELGGLRRRDVDLLHGSLRVERALKDVGGRLEFGPTKTGKPRLVGLPKFLVEMHTAHLDSIPLDPDALIFTGPEGGPLRHDNFYSRYFRPLVGRPYCRSCREAIRQRGAACPGCGAEAAFLLPPDKRAIRFHDLRHTCASLLIAANAHPKAIQEHLGHKNIQTTFNIYGHLLPSARVALAAALDSVFEEAPEEDESTKQQPVCQVTV